MKHHISDNAASVEMLPLQIIDERHVIFTAYWLQFLRTHMRELHSVRLPLKRRHNPYDVDVSKIGTVRIAQFTSFFSTPREHPEHC